MNTNLYCLFDRVSNRFMPTFEQVNDAAAAREVRGILRRDIILQPEDYDLVRVCELIRTEDEGQARISVREISVVVPFNRNLTEGANQ